LLFNKHLSTNKLYWLFEYELRSTLLQIIIPMSGFGERFRRAGYTVPKPLIQIDNKPIIGHVIDMFPGESDFIFICNQDHLDNPDYRMENIIKQYCPTGHVIGIPPHKLGPIHAVQQVEHLINSDSPTIVNYCDFSCYWNWEHFKKYVQKSKCAGAIPAYKGFHPHSLGSTNYAYIREDGGWLEDIQEKQPYTDNRMEEFASSGTYYFATGKVMMDAFTQTRDQDLNIGGEYYVSLAYKPLLNARMPVAVYPLEHFMQWGTPSDVAEYNNWSSIFKRLNKHEPKETANSGSLVIPMAGLGQRFTNEGYPTTKPLIPVSGQSMVIQATHDLPSAIHHAFVLRDDMEGYEEITTKLKGIYPKAVIETISSVTDGQACTALLGLEALEHSIGNAPGPITFGACDNGALYSAESFKFLADNPEIDVIVWGVSGHANAARHPNMFGWINEDNGKIKNISVKTPLNSPTTDPIVVGTFTFRHAEDFRRTVKHLIDRDGRINGEFYIDSCINDAIEMGLKCQLFEIDHLLSWGTPNDLRTFEYWQSCFQKWPSHPYQLELDSRIPKEALQELKSHLKAHTPEFLDTYHAKS
jgi:NDP-sugar pyrophosphorylase family protein